MSNLLNKDDSLEVQLAINSLTNDSNPVLTSIQPIVNYDGKDKTSKNLLLDDFEKCLFSEERLDASSPVLWPEQIPGVTDFLARSSSPISNPLLPYNSLMGHKSEQPEWLRDLDQDDINMLHGLGSLTTFALLDKVRELQDLSFQLGLEEAREMTRGKFLSVLSPNPFPKDFTEQY